MSSVITIFLTVGSVAAMFTALEFILSTIAVFAVRPTLSGLLLCRLYLQRRIKIRRSSLRRIGLRRELLTIILAAWFAAATVFVEQSLTGAEVVTSIEVANHSRCRPLNVPYVDDLMHVVRPSVRLVLDTWSSSIAPQLGCTDGITTLDFGDTRGVQDDSNSLAPECYNPPPPARRTALENGSLEPSIVRMQYGYWTGVEPLHVMFMLVPYELSQKRKAHANHYDPIYEIEECVEKGIASFPQRHYYQWHIKDIDDYAVSLSVLQELCVKHGNESVAPISDSLFKECTGNNTLTFLPCITRTASLIHTIDLPNMSAIFIDTINENVESTSVCCTDAVFRLHYVFVSTDVTIDLLGLPENTTLHQGEQYNALQRGFSIPLITRVDTLKGTCEPTLHALGLNALIYAANAEWKGQDTLLTLPRQQRYHAYMVSLARLHFPLDELTEYYGHCNLREVHTATHLQKDWKLGMLAVVTALCVVLVACAFVCRCMFPRQAWRVATPERLFTCEGPKEMDDVEVVVKQDAKEAESGNEDHDNDQIIESVSSAADVEKETGTEVTPAESCSEVVIELCQTPRDGTSETEENSRVSQLLAHFSRREDSYTYRLNYTK